MFEIPDEDDAFWEELPLDDVTNLKAIEKGNGADVRHGEKRLSGESHIDNGMAQKKFKSGFGQESVAYGAGVASPSGAPELNPADPLCPSFQRQNEPILVPDTQDKVAGAQKISVNNNKDSIVRASSTNSLSTPKVQQFPNTCLQNIAQIRTDEVNIKSTETVVSPTDHCPQKTLLNKCRRKFPGPAGLLPKLSHGRFPDEVEVTPTGKKSTSPELSKDNVILSSQSGEEVFSSIPWKSLITDLGKDSEILMRKFSVAGYLHKARKKLLPCGKVPLLMCLIETLDQQGSDASVCLRDTTGRIQGTIHRDLMRDHEPDLQPGSVLVLRQVGVISPTPRNHYLNITPSNIAMIYTEREGGLNVINDLGGDKSLLHILQAADKEMNQENVHRRRSLAIPATSNPVHTSFHSLQNSTPNGLNQRHSFGGPGDRSKALHPRGTTQSPFPGGVTMRPGDLSTQRNDLIRQVSFNPSAVSHTSDNSPACLSRSVSASAICNKSNIEQQTSHRVQINNSGYQSHGGIQNRNSSSSYPINPVQSGQRNPVPPVLATVNNTMSVRARNTSSSVSNFNTSIQENKGSNSSDVTFRDDRLNSSSNNLSTDTCRKGFRFKTLNKSPVQSQTLKPSHGTQSSTYNQGSASHASVQSNSKVPQPVQKGAVSYEAESLWQDDLSDEMLSQLSDDLI